MKAQWKFLISGLFSLSPLVADSLFEKAREQEAKAKSLGGEFEVTDLYKLPKKTFKTHDLITVKIKETIKQSNKKDSSASTESALLAEIKKHFTLDTAFTENSDLYGAKADVRTGTPGMDAKASKDFKGSMSIKDDTSFEAIITCEVIQVLPNGNLVLEAKKTTKQNKEEQTILFTGLVRSEDIDTSNIVDSSRIANSRVEYIGKGPLSNSVKKGLLSRLVDFVLPL
jgi:flagellar L-ring protein precursor FlgH